MEKQPNEHLETLDHIRTLMERSGRFISLSGLSGVGAGIVALLGAAMVYVYLGILPFENKWEAYQEASFAPKWGLDYLTFFLLDAGIVFLLALAIAYFFTHRKAKQAGMKTWDAVARRMVVNLAIPLVAGGIFCIALYLRGMYGLIGPSTLVFYGLALVNGGKYTLDDIRYLGITEILLGLFGLFVPGFGLEIWALGFGVLHIFYGILMYRKYES